MRKRLVAIYSVLVVAIVLLAGLGLGCPNCTIVVNATICGFNWTGNVSYNLTGPGTTLPVTVTGTFVPLFYGVDNGSWICAYVSGGPAGAHFVNITPSATQSVSANGTITFTLNFEKDQDAAIEFSTWTINGTPVQGGLNYSGLNATPCQIIDAHFLQWVDGCQNYTVTLNETSWLNITQIGGPGPATILVVNDWCAVNKTPAPLQKVSQLASVNNVTVSQNYSVPLAFNMTTTLDVHTQWQLVKCLNYTKNINWLGISFGVPGPHPCVLFELVVPAHGVYQFTLQTFASVELVNAVDGNNSNNQAMSPPITLWVIA